MPAFENAAVAVEQQAKILALQDILTLGLRHNLKYSVDRGVIELQLAAVPGDNSEQ